MIGGAGYCRMGMWRVLQHFIMMRSDAMALIAVRKSYEQQRRRPTNTSTMRRANVTFALLWASFYLLLLLHFSDAVTFSDCGSTLGKFTEVSVSGCHPSDAKCALVRGTNASISIKFVPNQDISKINVRVYGVLLEVPVPFPFDRPNVCTDPDDGVECPLHKDQEYHYTTSLLVQKKFPPVSVDIKWEFVDEKEEKIVCIEFPAKVK